MFKKSTGAKPSQATNATKSVPTPAPAVPTPSPKPAAGPASTSVSEIKPRAITHDDIARAAYYRWKTHGGDAHQNWVAAEQELRSASAT